MHKVIFFTAILSIFLPVFTLAGQNNLPLYERPEWQIGFLLFVIIVFLFSSKKIKTIIFGVALATGMVYLLIRLVQAWQGL